MTTNPRHTDPTMRLLLERSSCRNFADRKIPPDVLRQVLEAGIHAPTAGNLQPYSIIQIENQNTRGRLAELAGGQGYVAKAPVVLLFCIDWHRLQRWAQFEIAPFTATSSFRHFWLSFQDTLICAQTISTAADAVGLGSVYIGTIMEGFSDLRDLFRLPKGVFPVVLLCLGYPASRAEPARKLGVDVVVHKEQYHELDNEELSGAFEKKYPGREREITEERIQKIAEVCRRVHGKQFALSCVERIRKNGHINAVQTYFGLHYSAHTMPEDNDVFLQIMEDLGFDWFKEYRPLGE